MAFSKLTGKGIDLTTNVITEFNSTGIDDNATSTAITIAANNSVAIPNLHGNTTTVGNLTVGGDFIVQGNNFTVDADSLRVEDSLIQLASNNETSDVIDIGFFGHYSNDGNTALHTGFFRDASDEQYYLFNGLEDANLDANNSVTTINRSGTGFTLASLNVGAITSDGAGYFNYTKVDNGAVYNSFSGASGVSFSSTGTTPCDDSGSLSDDTHDLGRLANRWQDLYLSNSISLTNATTSSFLQVSTNILQFGTSSTDALAIYTDNTERMRIDSAGSIGVGTDSPARILHIEKDGLADLLLRDTSTYSVGTGPAVIFQGNDSGSTITQFGAIYGVSNGSNSGELTFETRNSGSSAERMRIDSAGNVGIGTADPATSLAVQRSDTGATTNFANKTISAIAPLIGGYSGAPLVSLYAGYDGTIHAVDMGYAYDTAGYRLHLSTNDNTSGNPIIGLTIDSSQKVGIGTITPVAKLHVSSSSSRLQQWERSSNQVALEMSTVASGGWGFYDVVNAQYDIYGKSRKIGVGTSNPGGNLTINSGGATTTMTMESSWTSGIARIAFTGGSGGVDGSSPNSTAGKIESHASAPGGAATGELQFFTNQGDTFVQALRMDPYGQMYAHSWIDQGSGQTLNTTTTLNSTTFYIAKRVARTQNSDRFEAIVTHSGAWTGTEYMHIVFTNSGTIPFKFDVNVGRSGSERAFGKVTYECYIYWESDGDFRHFACSSAETTQNYGNMLRALDLPSGYVADDATGTSENGSSIWNYFVVRVPLNANMVGTGDMEVYFNLETQRRYDGSIYVGFV